MNGFLTNLFPGYKTFVAALGLLGVGLVSISSGDWGTGLQSILTGLAALGIRFAKQ